MELNEYNHCKKVTCMNMLYYICCFHQNGKFTPCTPSTSAMFQS